MLHHLAGATMQDANQSIIIVTKANSAYMYLGALLNNAVSYQGPQSFLKLITCMLK